MTQPQFQIVSIQKVPTRHAQSILCNSCNVLANIQNGQSFLQSCGKHIEWSKFSAVLRQSFFIILNFLAILLQTLMFLQTCRKLAALFVGSLHLAANICKHFFLCSCKLFVCRKLAASLLQVCGKQFSFLRVIHFKS